MKIVVTGGSGFVGRSLVKALIEHGHEVTNLDLKPDPDRQAPWRYTDLLDKHQVVQGLEGAEAVVHFGEIPGVFGPFAPEDVYARNCKGGALVLQSAFDLGIRRAVYASTCQIYGSWGDPPVTPQYLPIDEAHPANPQNPYALSKAANELYARHLVDHHGMSIAVLRFPAVWRGWMRITRETYRWYLNAREPLDGMSTYVGAEDVALAVRLILESDFAGYDEFNIAGDGLATTLPTREYLQGAYPTYPALPDDFPEFGSPVSTRKLRDRFGWAPTFNVVERVLAMKAEVEGE